MRRLLLGLAVALLLIACGPAAKAPSSDQADFANIATRFTRDEQAMGASVAQVRVEIVGQMRLADGTVVRFYHLSAVVNGQGNDWLLAKLTDAQGSVTYIYTQPAGQLGGSA